MIKGITYLVPDLQKAVNFFCNCLNCKEVWRTDQLGDIFSKLYQLPDAKMTLVNLSFHQETIYVVCFDSTHIKEYPFGISGNDLVFQHIAIVVSDMDRALEKLKKHRIENISSQPQTIPEWNEAAAGIQAFYFRSPTGYPMELISFPKGKGQGRWQEKTDLFLGIDHTAITVSDTAHSLAFYQDILGLKVVGETVNSGKTQEKLSGVEGARVKITTLHSQSQEGIGLEFLHYLSPEIKKSSFEQIAEHEQLRIHLVLEVENFNEVKKVLDSKQILAEGTIEFDQKTHKTVVIEDPDHHRILLIQK